MIYEFVKDRLQTVAGLQPVADPQAADGVRKRVFPTGANIDGVKGAFAVYTMKKRSPVKDLSCEVHHYVEEVLVDFLGVLFDEIHELYCAAEGAFDVSEFDTGHGEYIFSVNCENAEPDALDVDTALLRRSMLVTINWCPIE